MRDKGQEVESHTAKQIKPQSEIGPKALRCDDPYMKLGWFSSGESDPWDTLILKVVDNLVIGSKKSHGRTTA